MKRMNDRPPDRDRNELDRLIANQKQNQWMILLLFGGLLLGWAAHSFFSDNSRSSSVQPPETNTSFKNKEIESNLLQQSSREISRVSKQIAPSVVNITTEVPKLSLWGIRRKEENQGTGVILNKDGLVLTNFHVVKGNPETVSVTLHNQKRYENVKLVGLDQQHDLALLKIKSSDSFQPAPLGDSKKLNVGEWVIAIGNPFGLEQSVTLGIVSAKDRGEQNFPFTGEGFIQTDAAINPGNSGGPLINLNGEVIGINSMIYSKSGGSQGVGFSIPINAAQVIMDRMKEQGRVRWGSLGVKTVNLDRTGLAYIRKTYNLQIQSLDALAEKLKLDHLEGVFVTEIDKPGPAWKAGIKIGDVIVGVAGNKIRNNQDLHRIVMKKTPGETVTVKTLRNGQPKFFDVTVGAR